MPVKLSGELVEEARHCAKLFHRSLTSQIEHWAALGRALESRLSADALAPLLENRGGLMKITHVAEADQRQKVITVLTEFLKQTPEATDHSWLAGLSAQGIPLYGMKAGRSGIIRTNPDGQETPMGSRRKAAR